MKFSKVFVDAISYHLPSTIVMTSDLEERLSHVFEKLHIPEGQLEEMTGIYERRWWEPGVSLAECAAEAGAKAFAKSYVRPEDIELLIYAGVCRDNFEPATATAAADRLGIGRNAMIFDLSNACLGVINAVIEIASHIELGHIKAGMVVSAESAREINEVTIRKLSEGSDIGLFLASIAVLTGGSGSSALILTDGSFGNKDRKLLYSASCAAPEFNKLCTWGMEKVSGELERMFMLTDSSAVLKNGVELAKLTWKTFLKNSGWNIEDIDGTICHQVGLAHRIAVLKALGLSVDRDFVTYPYLGNMGTVSLPITAAIAEERGFLNKNMKTAFMGIGSGLNCMMLGLEW